ncbi:MAG: glycosyltransferase family 4 protein [Candidatus Dojkabacteria bacterium]|nr:glycosyltransferase family 4 protein [Candidatus Dojkabacteria bacterium]
MRLLLLNYEYPPLGGGAATATYNMLQQFKNRKDLDVTLLTSSVAGFEQEKIGRNIRIIKFDIKKDGELHNQSNRNLLSYSSQAYKWIISNRKEFDLIHAFFGIPCGFIAMLSGLPYIVSLRGSDVPFYSPKYEKLDKYVFKYLDRIIWRKAFKVFANSEGLRDLAYKTYDRKEIGLIYNGVDTDIFKPAIKDKGFIVVSTSRLTSRKGLDYLLKAFAKFEKGKKDVELRFYGDGEEKENLIELAKKLKIENSTEFFGDKNRKDLAVLVPKCHVFVLSSKNEGMSNSLLEAMASGLACIATNVGGAKELIDGGYGIIVKKESVEEIYKGLELLYKDKKLLKSMSKKARGKVEKMGWNNMASKYIKIYEEVCE